MSLIAGRAHTARSFFVHRFNFRAPTALAATRILRGLADQELEAACPGIR